MSKTAFMFPGQGTQYMGMGKDFYDNIPVSQEVFQLADRVLDFDIKEVCFQENQLLNVTQYTQAAMVTTCLAIWKVIDNAGIKAEVTAGLSLGEYCALTAAGALSVEDAIKVTRQRGLLMEEAVPAGKGTMAVVLGLPQDKLEEVCGGIDGIVVPANYNCPGQIVISGETAAVEAAGEQLKEAGAKRILPLKVSGPFHSPMLEPAGEKLRQVLEGISFGRLNMSCITNVTAKAIENTESIRELLVSQVSSPVYWEQSVQTMLEMGVDTFVEIGPGKTLSGFVKKIDRTKTTIQINQVSDLSKLGIEV